MMVLVSDGEDLEGEVDAAVRAAKEKGVVVHTVGVGTEAGQPVPETDAEGRVTGYKRDDSGNPVVSRLQTQTLESIARGTGGRTFRSRRTDTSLSRLAAAIEGLEQKTLAQEYSYRRKERFQVPLAVGLACLAAGLLCRCRGCAGRGRRRPKRVRRAGEARRRRRRGGARGGTAWPSVLAAAGARARRPARRAARRRRARRPLRRRAGRPARRPRRGAPRSVVDEVLLRPKRATAEGRGEYERGNHPQAL